VELTLQATARIVPSARRSILSTSVPSAISRS
jgi:hypothetical protein